MSNGPEKACFQPLAWENQYSQVQAVMEENFSQVSPRERQIVDLLLQGCDNAEIARDLNMAERTVKAYFNRLFVRFGIKGGIKRVKLATLLYRRQLWLERQQSAVGPSEREQFIIQLVAEGCKNREIADSLGTTEHVVKNYLRLIYDKLGMWNRVELALWYVARQDEQVYQA
jgi:DNA-binding NarL/FixJ family response regulator